MGEKMKTLNFLKKFILALVCISLFNGIVVCANEDILRGYDENFEYSDESVGRALKSTTVKVKTICQAELSYTEIVFRTDKIISDIINFQRNNPEIPANEIFELALGSINDYLYYGSNVTKNPGYWSWGSGVVLTQDGYIATNNHVVTESEEDRCIGYINNALGNTVNADLEQIVQGIESVFGQNCLSEEDIQNIYNLLLEEFLSEAKITNEQITYQVLFPSPNDDDSENMATIYEAEVVNTGNGLGNPEDGAIIKINASNLVSLDLSPNIPETNSHIWAAGYPGNADIWNIDNSDAEASKMTATVTNGVVSAVKAIDDSKYKVIQTDAAVDHGSSGGPSINRNLDVIGLNTYSKATDTQGNFNFMVSSELIRNLLPATPDSNNELSKIFKFGLQALDGGYGLTATDCFKKVKEINPNIPYINELIKCAEKLPQNKINKFDIETIAVYGGISFVSILTLVIIILFISKSRKHKSVYNVIGYGTELELGGQLGGDSLDSGGLLTEENNELGAGGDSLL